jgi:hypothetical protein
LVQHGMTEDSPLVKQVRAIKGEDGLWRVSTKILWRDDLPDFKRPILIPGEHPIVGLIVRDVHEKSSHAGTQALLSIVREKYWISRARQVARKVVSACVRCRRFDTKKILPPEPPLPLDRVKDAAVFEVVGIDLGGPLYLKGGMKSWFVVYTCAVYRAVHLELVTSLSTDAFVLSLRRFIARRGRPKVIYSDNGTNFEGAHNLLRRLDWTKIQGATQFKMIDWKFSPPSAPWWGGFWERVVGMVKKLLRRILGRASLEYEELQTILCDIEEVINSRPLTYAADEADDLLPLTPNTFLRDLSCAAVGDFDETEAQSLSRRSQFRLKLKEDLRKRFRSEYLGLLVHRLKKSGQQTIKVGDVVLIGDDLKKRMEWKLGKVLEVYPGRDGIVRVARLKTSTGELTRAVQRLYPMEYSEDSKQVPSQDEDKVVQTRSGRVVKKPERFSF